MGHQRKALIPALLFILTGCGEVEQTDTRVDGNNDSAEQFQRTSVDLVSHGERISRVLGCNGCHGDDLTGEDWSEDGFGRLWTANLTRAVANYSDEQLAEVIRTGRQPEGRELWEMPSHLFTQLSPDDMRALIAYLKSQPQAGKAHPPPLFEEGAKREVAAGTFKSSYAHVRELGNQWPPDAGKQHSFARYIVRATCAECHGMKLEGGQPHPEATIRPNLRIASAYEREQFHHLMRTGKAVGNREVGLMSDVARGRYRHLTDEEVEAVYRYLHALGSGGKD